MFAPIGWLCKQLIPKLHTVPNMASFETAHPPMSTFRNICPYKTSSIFITAILTFFVHRFILLCVSSHSPVQFPSLLLHLSLVFNSFNFQTRNHVGQIFNLHVKRLGNPKCYESSTSKCCRISNKA